MVAALVATTLHVQIMCTVDPEEDGLLLLVIIRVQSVYRDFVLTHLALILGVFMMAALVAATLDV